MRTYDEMLLGMQHRMREIREGLGLTYRSAGERTGVSFTNISRYETGRGVPGLDVLLRLAVGYGVDIAEFFADPPAKPRRRTP